MRDGKLKKYNSGHPDFWKKEHQIKVWAVEYQPVGFSVLHKQEALDYFAELQREDAIKKGEEQLARLHRYYWEINSRNSIKPPHPGENDDFLPDEIRGKHFNSWTGIAEALGYSEESKC